VTNPPQNGTSFAGGSRENVEQGEPGIQRAANGSALASSTTQQENSTNDNSRPAARQDIPLQSDANTAHYLEGDYIPIMPYLNKS